jgi:hypothetical protein
VADAADIGLTPAEWSDDKSRDAGSTSPPDLTAEAERTDGDDPVVVSGTSSGGAVEEQGPVRVDSAEAEVRCEAAADGDSAVKRDAAAPRGLPGVLSKLVPGKLGTPLRASSVGKAAIMSAVIYLVVAGAFYGVLFKPAGARVERLSGELSVLHDYLVIEQANAALAGFKDGLMKGDQRLTVMSEFKVMAESAGVRIVGDPELLVPRSVSKTVSEYPVRLRLKGTYHEIGTFLALLESSPRFVQIEEVEILSDVASRDRESEASVLLALSSWEE